MYNRLIFIGYVGIKYEYKNELFMALGTQDNKDNTITWHNLKFTNKIKKYANKLNKGDIIQITGKLNYDVHNEKTYINIVIDHCKLLIKNIQTRS